MSEQRICSRGKQQYKNGKLLLTIFFEKILETSKQPLEK